MVRAALQAAECSADRFVFEVTETALVTDMAAAVDSLREARVRFAVSRSLSWPGI